MNVLTDVVAVAVVVADNVVDANDEDKIAVAIVVSLLFVDAMTVTSNAIAKDSGCLLLPMMHSKSLWYCSVVM